MNLMRKVLLVSLLIIGITGISYAEDRGATSPVYESVPEEIVIYEGNLAYAKGSFEVYPAEVIQVALPTTAIPRTIEIVDGGKKIYQLSLGTLENINQPKLSTISWKAEGEEKRRVDMSYLMTGIRWSPSYMMTILSEDEVRMRYNVAIYNSSVYLPKVKVKLISGMVGGPTEPYRREMLVSQTAISGYEELAPTSAAAPAIGPTRVNAYYAYELGEQEISRNSTSFIALLEEELDADKQFVWAIASGERVDVVYTIHNSTEQPFAEGLVDVYENDIYMGTDNIEWTPSDAKGHVTIGGAVDIQVTKTIDVQEIPERGGNDEFFHKMELRIDNFSKEDIRIKVVDTKYRDSVEMKFVPSPSESKAMTYLWDLDIPAGKTRIIKYSFYSDSTYTNPYRNYY